MLKYSMVKKKHHKQNSKINEKYLQHIITVKELICLIYWDILKTTGNKVNISVERWAKINRQFANEKI